jgi:isopropylmalate/homocitrate/citramalate synthase
LTNEPPEIIVDPQERWWVSRLNRLSLVQQQLAPMSHVRFRDCTIREGEEMPGVRLSYADKLSLARKIQETGIGEMEVGYCGAIDEHRKLAKFLRDEGISVKLTSINRSYGREGEWQQEIDLAAETGVDGISFVVFANDDLLTSVPWLPKRDVPDRVTRCVTYARNAGLEVAATVAGASRTTPRWIEACSQAAASSGANVIGIADSMGCALPETVSYLVHLVRDAVGHGPMIAFHGHNTLGLATANAISAVRAGAQVLDAVPLGLGEGAGIAPLEEMAFILEALYDIRTGLKVDKIADLCREVARVFGVDVLPTKTFIGRGIYRHSIDSHIASILRGAWYTWECVHPSVVGQTRHLEFGFAKLRRGRSGAIAAKIEQMGQEVSDEQLDTIVGEIRAITESRDWATEAEVEAIIAKVAHLPS